LGKPAELSDMLQVCPGSAFFANRKKMGDMKKLTKKQNIFCHEYIKDWNGTRAAIAAGYSKKTAALIAHENIRKPNIQAFINKIEENIEKEAGLSKLLVLLEHKKIAFSSISHLHQTWIERTEFDKLTGEQKACIQEISTKTIKKNTGTNEVPEICEIEYVKIKLYDKQKSLDSITKMLGFEAPQSVEIKGFQSFADLMMEVMKNEKNN
jgi:phage terminase small subunit